MQNNPVAQVKLHDELADTDRVLSHFLAGQNFMFTPGVSRRSA
jgi:hypothetical protein